MEIIPREKCCITGEALEPLLAFPNSPVHMSCVTTPAEKDIFSDMEFGISPKGVIQLTKLLPLEVLYEEFHGSGSVGGKWGRHHKQFAEFIAQYNPKHVLEVGAGHGILSQFFAGKTKWTIVEPTPGEVSAGVEVIKGFFNDSFELGNKYDCIVHSHFFEHLYEPNKFLSKIFNDAPVGTRHIFTLPNFDEWFKNFDLNTLNFEHTVLLTEDVLDYLLQTNGFKILQKEMFEDHSFFYATETAEKVEQELPNNYNARKEHFLKNFGGLRELMQKLNISNEDLFLFGGHIFSQFCIMSGLDPKLVIAILDNDPGKIGKRLYGTKNEVMAPAVLSHYDKPKVLLKAGRYTEEIAKQLMELNPEVQIIR